MFPDPTATNPVNIPTYFLTHPPFFLFVAAWHLLILVTSMLSSSHLTIKLVRLINFTFQPPLPIYNRVGLYFSLSKFLLQTFTVTISAVPFSFIQSTHTLIISQRVPSAITFSFFSVIDSNNMYNHFLFQPPIFAIGCLHSNRVNIFFE